MDSTCGPRGLAEIEEETRRIPYVCLGFVFCGSGLDMMVLDVYSSFKSI